ncbi:NAD(P)/FAD-dependent oxidoreductase [Deinococcus deserti]|uniref:Putative FAD-dependent oxidoreductase n=1 Tax=Deinococcus deserti (strain DSM 17065 / CIP 109153 / LMG 22923 / VCD115) TaxID=546414 RepID=C1D284_DEIDV|nr:NAD(P)/FAD-dependent oxidoreductase [Deinococcus deserti]ACO47523.1 putative FAD-dependent oxidoreductase [Deinococcus deserti VCD115]
MDDTYEVLIVGARVAGAALATFLGEAGHKVLLVDRASFPSPTPSTHFFRGAHLVRILKRLGVLTDVLNTGAPPLTRELFYFGGSPTPVTSAPQDAGDIGHGLSVRRATLDSLLVRRAQSFPSVTFLPRTRVGALLKTNERVTGARLVSETGESFDVQANIVVGADGRHSFIARAVQAPIEESAPAVRGMFYRYVNNYPSWDGCPLDAAEFSLFENEITYVFPSDAGTTCHALSVGSEHFHWIRERIEDRFKDQLERHPGVKDRLLEAHHVSRVLASYPEPSVMRVPAGPGWALVGDAGVHQDPWSGVGMDCAGTHAELLAEELTSWLNGRAPEDSWRRRYHQRRNSHVRPLFQQTISLARDLRPITGGRHA